MRYLEAYNLNSCMTQADREDRYRQDRTCNACGFDDVKAIGHNCPGYSERPQGREKISDPTSDQECKYCDYDTHVCGGCGEPLRHDGNQFDGKKHEACT